MVSGGVESNYENISLLTGILMDGRCLSFVKYSVLTAGTFVLPHSSPLLSVNTSFCPVFAGDREERLTRQWQLVAGLQ